MRVISGKLKGRVLKGYNIEGTRPTMDRVKESIFASIYDYLDSAVVLDLFAGSGNLGIEAISNGADFAYFVDINRECIKVINDNIKMFNIEKNCVVLKKDYQEALNYFKLKNIKFDIIFIDPPYRFNIMDKLMRMIMDMDLLNNDGIIVLEYQNNNNLDNNDYFKLLKDKRYGDKFVSIMQKNVVKAID